MKTFNLPPRTARTALHPRQAGLSLVELMVAVTIGLILVAGLAALVARQSASRTELEKSSRQIENGRYAIELLREDIAHAGFYSDYSPPKTAVFSEPDPCLANATGWSPLTPQLPVPVYGYAGAAADPTPSACLPDYKPNTAVIAVRRASTGSPTDAASGVPGTLYIQVSRCSQDTWPFLVATSGFTLRQKDCLTLATLRNYIVRIYYVSNCNECGSGGDTVPTLKVVEFADGAVITRPLVEGIEDMQFDYGIDTSGDGAPDSYTTAPTAGQWQDVVAVGVNLLARNIDQTPGYVDRKSYQLSAVSGVAAVPAFNDAYKRHVYSQLVRVVNPSSRREAP